MKQIKCIFNIFLLLIFISFIFNVQIQASTISNTHSQSITYRKVSPEVLNKFESLFDLQKINFETQDWSNLLENSLFLSYDEIMNLLDELESVALEKKYSSVDLERLNQLLALLAKKGILLDNPYEDLKLQDDIEELLSEESNSYEYTFSLGSNSEYIIVPAVFSGYDYNNVVLCKSWIKKQWKHTKKFVKKHKKEIIIGAVVVTAVVVTVAVVATTAAAAAAAGAGATSAAVSSGSGNSETIPSESKESAPVEIEKNNNNPLNNENIESFLPKNESSDHVIENKKSLLTEILEENISSFKADLQDNNHFNSSETDQNLWDKTKEILRESGAHLSHKVLDEVSDYAKIIPGTMQEIGDCSDLPLKTVHF